MPVTIPEICIASSHVAPNKGPNGMNDGVGWVGGCQAFALRMLRPLQMQFCKMEWFYVFRLGMSAVVG